MACMSLESKSENLGTPQGYVTVEGQDTLASVNDPECKHWRRTRGNCAFGDQCKFQHLTITVLENNQTKQTIRDSLTGKRKRQRPRNKGRAGEFRRWLITKFGVDLLRQGSGILDIAGGKGEISFELLNLNHCPSTIIDPRNYIDYSRFERKLLRGFYHRNELLMNFNQCKEVPSQEDVRFPKHLKAFWGPNLWECLSMCEDKPCNTDDYDDTYSLYQRSSSLATFNREENLLAQLKKARDFTWTDKGLQVNHLEEVNHQGDEWRFEEIQYLLQNCSCIVGMHPDQAAEGIVDFALRMNKPFALIPCCVYSKQFPRKKTKDGRPVSNYQDLIDHLCAKDERIRTEVLPFEGKNTIVYCVPYIIIYCSIS